MEEIDLTELLSYFKNKLWLVIGIVFLILLLGNLYSVFLKTPIYKSSSTIVIASNNSSNNIQTDITVNQKLVGTYKEIVKSRSVVEQVIEGLDLDYSYGELYNNIYVESVTDTEILKISVTNKDPEMAKEITDSLANAFKEQVIYIYNLENVKILDDASMSNKADNVNFYKEEVIYFCAGLFVSCFIVLMLFYFDKNIRSVEQVEAKLGLPILGTIPICGGKK